MDGLQILFYIVVAIIYFIIQARKQAKNAQPPTTGENTGPDPTMTQNSPPRKTNVPTLQDLLNEFGEATRKNPQPQATIEQRPEPANLPQKSFYEEAEEKARQQKRKVELKAQKAAKRAAEAKRAMEVQKREEALEDLSYEQTGEEYVPTYENKASLVDYEDPTKSEYEGLNDSSKNRFAAFDIRKVTPNMYAQLFKNPETARTAFIMGEIFKRKYD
ncbi:hypothetical protein GXP67_07255 [Rhodocytophaga rosea]|uniref:Uncharacterized protein n=1 Tax=Rhodocytophaga rosea TaxID=2704465 RepID=A0A6C0GER7_9BACT|nr:hypothetical protein [Rhodocytophaga rosea]QHT66466.1 hypothetical protein GXP67_07255 [Rhodocytophaga rosea]